MIKFIRATSLRYDEGLIYCKEGTITTNQYYKEIEHIEGKWYYYIYRLTSINCNKLKF